MLPNAERASVPTRKLLDYLLDLEHPDGGPKARFFRAHGFDESTVGLLKSGLLTIASDGVLLNERPSAYGTGYAIVGDLHTPRGTTVRIRTVWIIDAGQSEPRFVSAYPDSARPSAP